MSIIKRGVIQKGAYGADGADGANDPKYTENYRNKQNLINFRFLQGCTQIFSIFKGISLTKIV